VDKIYNLKDGSVTYYVTKEEIQDLLNNMKFNHSFMGPGLDRHTIHACVQKIEEMIHEDKS